MPSPQLKIGSLECFLATTKRALGSRVAECDEERYIDQLNARSLREHGVRHCRLRYPSLSKAERSLAYSGYVNQTGAC